MKIDADVQGDAGAPEVVTEQVQAQHLQQWMVIYVDDDEFDVVMEPPAGFRRDDDTGRPQRWVRVDMLEGEPLTEPATSMVDILFGTPVDQLQPMLDEDLYTDAQWALATNGMCHEDVTDDEDDDDVIVYCGKPSDPDSVYRLCPTCDEAREQKSDDLADRRGYRPVYGQVVAVTP